MYMDNIHKGHYCQIIIDYEYEAHEAQAKDRVQIVQNNVQQTSVQYC